MQSLLKKFRSYNKLCASAMIECVPGTVLPVDERVLHELRHDDHWVKWWRLRFDDDYLATLPSIHGGIPTRPFFTDTSGQLRRIGWFVSIYDDKTDLPGPRQIDHMYHESDTRIVDRSLPYLLDGECSIYAVMDDNPIRYYPLAALCEDPLDEGSAPFTLAWHFGCGNDSVGFDTSTSPFSIVYCNFENAIAAFNAFESDPEQPYDYSFLIRVADSFAEFAKQLRTLP